MQEWTLPIYIKLLQTLHPQKSDFRDFSKAKPCLEQQLPTALMSPKSPRTEEIFRSTTTITIIHFRSTTTIPSPSPTNALQIQAFCHLPAAR